MEWQISGSFFYEPIESDHNHTLARALWLATRRRPYPIQRDDQANRSSFQLRSQPLRILVDTVSERRPQNREIMIFGISLPIRDVSCPGPPH